ncbi:MAG: membrane protein insertase YidC [Bacteroidales bacterium]|nr:membrane protein insertase YidC [Bacteroidales bacterium]
MDKNSVIGFVLIALILGGFTVFQSRQAAKQMALQAQADSIALAQQPFDTVAVTEAAADIQAAPAAPAAEQAVYKDVALEAARSGEAALVTLENSKLSLQLSSRGAQPWSVLVKDYFNYDSTALYLLKPGTGNYSLSIYAGEYVRTSDFNFEVAEQTANSVLFRLPFAGGGCIEQRYTLPEDSYDLQAEVAFVGMQGVIPRNVSVFDIDVDMTIPRMEKGYKNEVQYSKLDYYQEGDKKPAEVGRGRNGSRRVDSRVSWFAFQQQFFSAILCAPQQFASGEFSVNFFPQEDPNRELMACSAKMRAELTPGAEFRFPLEWRFGPNHYQDLKAYERKYEKIIPLGGSLVGWFTKFVIIPIFNFLHKYIANFGIIILLMTLIIKLVVLPFTWKSYSSSSKMAALKPEIEKINERYPKQDDAMKKQQATMDLYKRAGVSPMGGCLPTLLTFPILWAMFRFFPASIELRQQPFLWAHDLSTYDAIVDFGSRVPLLGDHLSLFALLMAFTMWIYSKMTMSGQPGGNDPNAASMRFMSVWMMPIMMFFICNSLSAALSYYYLLSQLISMLEIWIIRKYFTHPEALLAKVRASEGKPVPKSKWQLRLEEAQRMQQQQQKQQKSGRR